jgi:SAM-dependent methyltransferase
MWPRTLRGEEKHRQHKRTEEVKLVLGFIRQLRAIDSSFISNTEILEFGSGDGFQLPYLQTIGHVTATDLYRSDNIKKYNGIEFVKCSITTAPFRANKFDIIFSNHVIEHITDLESAFKELRRIGKANCLYAFSVPTALWLLLAVPADYYTKVKKLTRTLVGVVNKNGNRKSIARGRQPASLLNIRRQAGNGFIPQSLRLLLPGGHGCHTGFIHCLSSFRVKLWTDLFQRYGFKILRIEPLLLYGDSEWPIIPTSRFLTRFGLCSSVLFLMEQVERQGGSELEFRGSRNEVAGFLNNVSQSELIR